MTLAAELDFLPIDADAVLDWYDANARDLPWRVPPAERRAGRQPDPYRVWLSEVMLQQTTIGAVKAYFARFTAAWPDVEALAAAPLDSVLREWAGLGYYARARNLHACARAVAEAHGGKFPASAEALTALPGIGAYTSAAIAAICRDERVGVLDGNVERVLARYWAVPVPVAAVKPALRAALTRYVPERAGDFAQAMMDIGATICAPRNAACMLCPLASGCRARQDGNPTLYPVKAVKPERPTRYGHAFVLRDRDGDVYLRQRVPKGLLGGMTEVPTSEWIAEAHAADFPLGGAWRAHGTVEHVFTHFRLLLDVWSLEAVDGAALGEGWWAPAEKLDEEALPSVFHKVLALALDRPRKRNPPGGTRRKSGA
jgi:A/G-specific adenine glycosylase